MTQTIVPSPPAPRAGLAAVPAPVPPATPRPVTLGGRISSAVDGARQAFAGTPGHLRILATLAVLASLAFGLAGGQAFRSSSHALAAADANTAQLVRLQAIHINLVRADADATNAFLVGGLEPADERADYTSAIGEAAGLIAQAAQAQPADAQALADLNTSLVTYAGLIEQARANNRQALPLGAQYLKNAGAALRADTLPVLEALVEANEKRVQHELTRASWASAWLIVGGIIALLVLGYASYDLARRTHRYINVPILGAGALVLVTLIVGGIALFAVRGSVHEVRDGPYAATLAVAKSRVAGFDAKSNESLTLIARGSGSAFEQQWKASHEIVTTQLKDPALQDRGPELADLWTDYEAVHTEIRKADDGGAWEDAVARATGRGEGSANATFGAFDTASAKVLAAASTDVSDGLTGPRAWLPFVGWLALMVGLVAAIAAWWGVALRLEEYR